MEGSRPRHTKLSSRNRPTISAATATFQSPGAVNGLVSVVRKLRTGKNFADDHY
jgi:hypothetical protein